MHLCNFSAVKNQTRFWERFLNFKKTFSKKGQKITFFFNYFSFKKLFLRFFPPISIFNLKNVKLWFSQEWTRLKCYGWPATVPIIRASKIISFHSETEVAEWLFSSRKPDYRQLNQQLFIRLMKIISFFRQFW